LGSTDESPNPPNPKENSTKQGAKKEIENEHTFI